MREERLAFLLKVALCGKLKSKLFFSDKNREMAKSFFTPRREFWFLISAVTLGVILLIFLALKLWNNENNRLPAQFSQQELQYAEILWGDEEEGVESPTSSYPSVQPQWEDGVDSDAAYNYSDPIAEDLQRQIQEDYHRNLYEEWKQKKQKAAATAAKKAASPPPKKEAAVSQPGDSLKKSPKNNSNSNNAPASSPK